MLLCPLLRRRVALYHIAGMFGVVCHHRCQLLLHLSVVVDDEELRYCEGAVNGGGNRFRSFVGSARTACNWSL
jgi:hypothetical protein